MKTHQKADRREVSKVFEDVFDKYDIMNDIMSFGIHRLWKRKFIDWLNPQRNTKLVDVASGTGDIAKLFLEKTFYQAQVFCVDENEDMLEINKNKLNKNKNAQWFNSLAEKLPFEDNQFDYYTISFGIRNLSNIDISLREAYRVLKPGGRFLCLEFSKTKNEIMNKLYKIYSKSIPKIGKLIVGKSEPYEYLVNSIEKFYTQEELLRKINEQNFENSSYRNLSGGIVAIHSAWKI